MKTLLQHLLDNYYDPAEYLDCWETLKRMESGWQPNDDNDDDAAREIALIRSYVVEQYMI